METELGESDGEGGEKEQPSSSHKEQKEEDDEICGVVSVINLTHNQVSIHRTM